MSRKITDKSIAAFLARRNFRQANISVHALSDGVYELRLHNNPIARLWPAGDLWISSARWNTRTTFARLNGLPGVSISCRNFQPYLNGQPWNGAWIEITAANTPTPNPELF